MKLLGFSAVHTRRLCDHLVDLPAYVALMTSPTWLRRPQRVTPIQRREVRRPGQVKRAELPGVLAALFGDPDVSSVALATRGEGLFVEIVVDGHRPQPYLAHSHGAHWIPGDDAARLDPWVRAVVDFLDATRAAHATIAIGTEDEIAMEGWMSAIRRDDKVAHHRPEQFLAMQAAHARGELGTRYVRFPRWGTLLSHQHLGSLGGVAAIEAAVRPPVLRELASGVYIQLTDSVATADSPDAIAKQRAFTELAAPLLPPQIECA